MNILTIGPSPYLLTGDAKINAWILEYLKKQGHNVLSAAWAHDASYFMPDENDEFHYEKDGKQICKISLLSHNQEKDVVLSFEVMKQFQPDIVISIGDYIETAYIHAIKQNYPQLFKWIAIVSSPSGPIPEEYGKAFSYADTVCATHKRAADDIRKYVPDCEIINVGPDDAIYAQFAEYQDSFRVMACLKNFQFCNIGAYVDAAKIVNDKNKNIKFYLHTNINDPGEYDLIDLIDNSGVNIELPELYVSIKDGISDEALIQEYKKSTLIIDPSVRCSSALSLLEGMRMGCVPLTSGSGFLGDVCSGMKHPRLHMVDSVPFIIERNESIKIVDPKDMAMKILNLYDLWDNKKEEFKELIHNCIEISQRYSKNILELDIERAIERVSRQAEMKLAVESFSCI